jgi:hypothetical protein
MRYFLLSVLVFALFESKAQPPCPKNSKLYQFDSDKNPRNFKEKLGNHPEFPFLQQKNGVDSISSFINAINSQDNQRKYAREFKAFDLLLHNSGFANGYHDLTESNVENLYLSRGTIGNLGFYDKGKDRINYIYVKLNPAGEDGPGIAAWKLTNAAGCYLYILHTCGNAFYPNNTGKLSGRSNNSSKDCCKTLTVESQLMPIELKTDSFDRPLHVSVDFYQGRLVPSKNPGRSNSGYDTLFHLIRHIDSLSSFKDRDDKRWKIYSSNLTSKLLICKDSLIRLSHRLLVDSTTHAGNHEGINFIISDTSYIRDSVWNPECWNKWAITLDGGVSFNSVPRFNSAAEHSQTNGPNYAGQLSISRFLKQWFQLGVSASFLGLSYQDDAAYPGSVAGTYNKVYLGNPIIPLQIFGQADIGKKIGWQSNVALSAGFSIPVNGKIENSGNTLSTKPSLKGGFTAGFKLGLDYFFSCRFGLGLSFSGQYLINKGALMNYNLFSLPITGGLRFRF